VKHLVEFAPLSDKQTDRHFIRRIRVHSHTKWFTVQWTWFRLFK